MPAAAAEPVVYWPVQTTYTADLPGFALFYCNDLPGEKVDRDGDSR